MRVVRALLHDPAVHRPPYTTTRAPPSLHPPCRTVRTAPRLLPALRRVHVLLSTNTRIQR
jgi:hypothetical protein